MISTQLKMLHEPQRLPKSIQRINFELWIYYEPSEARHPNLVFSPVLHTCLCCASSIPDKRAFNYYLSFPLSDQKSKHSSIWSCRGYHVGCIFLVLLVLRCYQWWENSLPPFSLKHPLSSWLRYQLFKRRSNECWLPYWNVAVGLCHSRHLGQFLHQWNSEFHVTGLMEVAVKTPEAVKDLWSSRCKVGNFWRALNELKRYVGKMRFENDLQ